MKLRIIGLHSAYTPAVREHAEQRIESSLARVQHKIREVCVRMGYVCEPKNGVDKYCKIEIRLFPSGSLHYEDVGEDMYTAINRTVDRAKRSLTRELSRKHKHRNMSHEDLAEEIQSHEEVQS